MKFDIYTDGACSGNGQVGAIGGWGYVILWDTEPRKRIAGAQIGIKNTTNQRMELMAAIAALRYLNTEITIEDFEDQVTIYTDSAYFYNCWKNNWYTNWRRNGWYNSKKEKVANIVLWKELIPWFDKPNFQIVKVQGHSNNEFNEICDKLATGKLDPRHL